MAQQPPQPLHSRPPSQPRPPSVSFAPPLSATAADSSDTDAFRVCQRTGRRFLCASPSCPSCGLNRALRDRASCFDPAGPARQRSLLNRLAAKSTGPEVQALRKALAATSHRDAAYAASYRPAAADAAVDEALRRAVASTAAARGDRAGGMSSGVRVSHAVAAQLSRRLELPPPPPAAAMDAWEGALEAWFSQAGTEARLAVFRQLFASTTPDVLRALASALNASVPDAAAEPQPRPTPALSPTGLPLTHGQPVRDNDSTKANTNGPRAANTSPSRSPSPPPHHLVPQPPSPGPHSSSSGGQLSPPPSLKAASATSLGGGSHSAPTARASQHAPAHVDRASATRRTLTPSPSPAAASPPPAHLKAPQARVDPLACLPMPLAKYVLSSLGPSDLRAAAGVSRTWRRAVAELKEDRLQQREASDLLLSLRQQGRDPSFQRPVDVPHPYASDGVVRRLERNIFGSSYTSLVCRDPNRGDAPRAAAVGPGGRMASAGADKILRLWDLRTGRLRLEIPGHAGSVHSLALCPRLGLLLTGSYDTSVRLWDEETGHCARILRGHASTVLSAAVCQVSLVAVTADKSGRVCLWDLQREKKTSAAANLALDAAVGALASGGGTPGAPAPGLFLAGCHNGQLLLLGTHRRRRRHGDGSSTSTSTSTSAGTSAGAAPARASPPSTSAVRLSVLLKRKAHKGGVRAVDMDAHFLVSAGEDHMACLWPYAVAKAASSTPSASVPERPMSTFTHVSEVTAVRIHGVRVLTGAADGRLRIWQALTGECLRVLRVGGPEAVVWSLHFLSDNEPEAGEVDSFATPSPDTLVANTAGSLQILHFPLSHRGDSESGSPLGGAAPGVANGSATRELSPLLEPRRPSLRPSPDSVLGRRPRHGSLSLPTLGSDDRAELLSDPPSPKELTAAPHQGSRAATSAAVSSPLALKAKGRAGSKDAGGRRDSQPRHGRPRLSSLSGLDQPSQPERQRPHMPLVPSSRASVDGTGATWRRLSTATSTRSSLGSVGSHMEPSSRNSLATPRASLSLATTTGLTAVFHRRQSTPEVSQRRGSGAPSSDVRRRGSMLQVPTLSHGEHDGEGSDGHPNFGRQFSGEWRTQESLARRRALVNAAASGRHSSSNLSHSWSAT